MGMSIAATFAVITLVDNRVFEVMPRLAVLYWLGHPDLPMLVFSVVIISH